MSNPKGHNVSDGTTVMCCGVAVAADEAEVQRVMIERTLSAEAQAREWLRLSYLSGVPSWIECCIKNARKMTELACAQREIRQTLDGNVDLALSAGTRLTPSDGLAERHFEWLGEGRHVPVGVVRDGIMRLADQGYISHDADQQAALRRGLGINVNHDERTSRAPWVRWLADADALNYLVDSLWQMELIYCSGGRRYKWQTLCGMFLRCDGTRYDTSIKSNRCTATAKRHSIDEAILDGLRFVARA